LIGSSDGKKFRTFAQGLTFDLMVTHANTKLQKMSDRYLLARDDNSPLELNVIDNYQGGEIRSTKNLSGGEGFIISLALALGLSQMASQNIRVDSLFLDEGFGTLDEESLDIALDTLTNLQQEGRLIGVISHVQALKDRILTQIKVEKLSGGFSRISGQGCHKVVSEKAS
jgi:exonuclease SbcC